MSNQIPQTEIDRIKGQANLYATGSAELYEAVYRANYDGRLSEYLHRSSAAPEPERAEGGYGEFNIGEWVICRFGNSGNKFWPQLAGAILRIADVVRHNEKPDQISFHFDQAQFFYANDFERVIIPNVPIGPFTGPVTPSPVSTPTALGTEGEEKGLCRWVKAGVRLPEKDGKIGIRIHGEDLSNGSVRTRKNGDRVICPFGLHSIWPGWKELEWLEELLSSQPTTSGEEKETEWTAWELIGAEELWQEFSVPVENNLDPRHKCVYKGGFVDAVMRIINAGNEQHSKLAYDEAYISNLCQLLEVERKIAAYWKGKAEWLETSKEGKTSFKIIVNGQPTVIEASENDTMLSIMERALVQTQNTARPVSDWTMRTHGGEALSKNDTVEDLDEKDCNVLFLSLNAGIGAADLTQSDQEPSADILKWIRNNNPCGIYEYNTWRKGALTMWKKMQREVQDQKGQWFQASLRVSELASQFAEQSKEIASLSAEANDYRAMLEKIVSAGYATRGSVLDLISKYPQTKQA